MEPQASACVYLPSTRIIGTLHKTHLFHGCQGSEFKSSHLCRKILVIKPPPRPSVFFLTLFGKSKIIIKQQGKKNEAKLDFIWTRLEGTHFLVRLNGEEKSYRLAIFLTKYPWAFKTQQAYQPILFNFVKKVLSTRANISSSIFSVL